MVGALSLDMGQHISSHHAFHPKGLYLAYQNMPHWFQQKERKSFAILIPQFRRILLEPLGDGFMHPFLHKNFAALFSALAFCGFTLGLSLSGHSAPNPLARWISSISANSGCSNSLACIHALSVGL